MTGALHGRDSHEVDALVTDRYLEALLAAHARGADRGPSAGGPPDPIRLTADRLARDLPRLHPSFRFEEALAVRLVEVAARMRLPTAVGGTGVMVPIAGRASERGSGGHDEADLRGPVGSRRPVGSRGPRVPYGRPLLIGGAITSAALSLAGAAYVAWRLNRPAVGPMARAVRSVARTRLARTRVARTRLA